MDFVKSQLTPVSKWEQNSCVHKLNMHIKVKMISGQTNENNVEFIIVVETF